MRCTKTAALRRVPRLAAGAVFAVLAVSGCASVAANVKPANNTVTQHSHAGRKVFPAREGKIVFVNAPAASGVLAPGRFAIQVIRPDGIGRTTIFSQHREIDSPPRWSPNGKQIVFSMNSARSTSSSLYIINANRTGLRKVSTGRRDNESPAWSPDGTKIAFSSHLASSPDQHIFVKDLKTGTVSRVTGGTAGDTGPAWSPDGTKIAFDRCGVRRGGTCHLWVKDLATGQLRQVTSGPSSDQDPAWSPDGRRIAFASSRTGRWNIFTMRAAGGGLVQVTNTKRGGLSLAPSWSPDGKWIAFEAERNGPFNIFAARAIRDGRVRRLTDVKPPRNAQYPDWRR